MKRSEIEIGGTYILHGDVVTVTEIHEDYIVVEGQQNGEEPVQPNELEE